jgi:hypothetical protein
MKKLPENQIAFYQAPDGSVNIEVLYAEENIWLTQKKMAENAWTKRQLERQINSGRYERLMLT